MSLERTMALAIVVMALAWALWPGSPASADAAAEVGVQADIQEPVAEQPRPGSA